MQEVQIDLISFEPYIDDERVGKAISVAAMRPLCENDGAVTVVLHRDCHSAAEALGAIHKGRWGWVRGPPHALTAPQQNSSGWKNASH